MQIIHTDVFINPVQIRLYLWTFGHIITKHSPAHQYRVLNGEKSPLGNWRYSVFSVSASYGRSLIRGQLGQLMDKGNVVTFVFMAQSLKMFCNKL
jgi:hypothetical protein